MTSTFVLAFVFILSYYETYQFAHFANISELINPLKGKQEKFGNLKEFISKFVIDIPNSLIKNETKNILENITLYGLYIDRIITRKKEIIGNKAGVKISIEGAALKAKGFYKILSDEYKYFEANVSNLNILFPFYLVKDNETGLIHKVDISGFNLDLENAEIDFDFEMPEAIKDITIGLLKSVLRLVNSGFLEKTLVQILNEKFMDLFDKIKGIIYNGVKPDELKILTKQEELGNLKKSSLMSAVAYLLNNLTGADGPFSFNNIANIFSQDTGIIHVKDFYTNPLNFEFDLNINNQSLGNFYINIDDIIISGLNTWKNFTALEPYNNILLNSYTDLENLSIDLAFTLKIRLDNSSFLVREENILNEKAMFRTNLINNTLKAMIQLPTNKNKGLSYTHQECLNLDCVMDLIDSNGTGITALSLNETFKYILLEVVQDGGLEDDLDNAIDKIVDLFVSSYSDKISLFINALLNSTIINIVNKQINNYLYTQKCPGVEDPEDLEIDKVITTAGFLSAFALFLAIIFYPYILAHACNKKKDPIKVNLLDNQEINERISNTSEIQNVKNYDMESQYCCSKIGINWIKEFGRTDPEGASLFLHPHVPIFWRIFIPCAILCSIALFASSNSGTGASVFVVLNVGRRIQVPSLFDFGLINSVRDMWKAGVYPLSLLIAVFSGFWPYLKLILMLISFVLPASILNKSRRETVLMILDATGKWSILDTYVMTLMLVAFHFHIKFPVVPPSEAEESSLIDVFVYAAYGFFTLILGTIISLILSHIITHLHRKIEEHPDQNKGKKAESYTALISFAQNKYLGEKLFRVIISFLLFLTLGLVLYGSLIISFSFNFHGLAGYALDLFNISPERDYSTYELGLSVPEAAEFPNSVVIRFTQVVYFLTIFFIPITMLVNVLILWFVPLPRKAQKIFYDIAEILNAWSCLDVFVVSIMAAILEIGQFAEFIVGDKCDFIQPIIEKYFGKILEGHKKCFEVKAYLKSGCWFLFAAAISYFISSFIVMKVCRNALNERLPDHVKEYIRAKKEGERISKIMDFSNRTTVDNLNDIRNTISKKAIDIENEDDDNNNK